MSYANRKWFKSLGKLKCSSSDEWMSLFLSCGPGANSESLAKITVAGSVRSTSWGKGEWETKPVHVLRGTHHRWCPGQSSNITRKKLPGNMELCVFCRITSPMVQGVLTWPRWAHLTSDVLVSSWRPSALIFDAPRLDSQGFIWIHLQWQTLILMFFSQPGFQVSNCLSRTGPSEDSLECSVCKF